MQVRLSAPAVGDPGHLDLTEDRVQAAGVSGLGVAAGHPLGVENLLEPGLPPGPQVQVVLQEQAEQLAGIDLKSRLQVGV